MTAEKPAHARGIHVCTMQSRSGIAAYAMDFHEVALAPEGYELVEPEAILNARNRFAPDTRFHVQLGVFQHRERRAMTRLLEQGYRYVDATVHDPPFATFPYFQFRLRLLMRLSRGFDWYLGSLGLQRRALERLRRIFVLSERGRATLLRLAPRANVTAIPHVVRNESIWPAGSPLEPALIHFGFIGPNKGIGYALELHRALNRLRPGTPMHVIGQPTGDKARAYFDSLRGEYREDVTFHGYVADDQIDALFAKAAHVVLPYTAYKYIMPASGSVVHALRRARVVWTTGMNAMPEIVRDGENGFMLSLDVERDARRLLDVIADETQSRQVSDAARQSAIAMANYPYRRHFVIPAS